VRCLSCLALLVGVILGWLFVFAAAYFVLWLILG
jgi:hypothetical protein